MCKSANNVACIFIIFSVLSFIYYGYVKIKIYFYYDGKNKGIQHLLLYTFILFILLPQLLSKEGVTLGRLLTKTRVCKLSGEEVNVKDILISNVFTFITFAIVIVISSLFTFGLTNLTVSILTIGEFTLTYLQLLMISILMIFIHLAFICFNYDHFTFSEFISKTQSKDLTYYIKEEK